MVEETPAKIISLLGIALASLVMLFVFSATDASFGGTRTQVTDPLALNKVMVTLDYAIADYSNFLQANVIAPATQQYAVAADNISWIATNAHDGLYAMLGIHEQSADAPAVAVTPAPGRVAGAHTVRYTSRGVFDSVFSVFMQ